MNYLAKQLTGRSSVFFRLYLEGDLFSLGKFMLTSMKSFNFGPLESMFNVDGCVGVAGNNRP